jgi:hypothetical protein
VLFRLDFHEQLVYVKEAVKAKVRDENFRTQLAYSAVVWNRVEPKDIPSLKDVLQQEEVAPEEVKPQSPQEMMDVLKTLAARSKRNKTVTRRRE